MLVYNMFSNKAEGLVLEIEKYSTMLLKKVSVFNNKSTAKKKVKANAV